MDNNILDGYNMTLYLRKKSEPRSGNMDGANQKFVIKGFIQRFDMNSNIYGMFNDGWQAIPTCYLYIHNFL